MRLRALVEYDGTDFAGWQRQAGGRSSRSPRRTVQGELELALRRVTGGEAAVVGAGRTDAGVHATGQAAHFDAIWSRAVPELERAVNAVLPADVAVRGVAVAPPGFHARHSATARLYRYTAWTRPTRSPLVRRTTLHVGVALDVERMRSAAGLLVGEHDFGGFGRAMGAEGGTVRRVHRIVIDGDGPRVWFDMEANAFLRHQVRRTVGLLLDVGRGRLAPESVRAVLARRAGAPVPRRAPAHGLVLVAVRYPPDEIPWLPGGAAVTWSET